MLLSANPRTTAWAAASPSSASLAAAFPPTGLVAFGDGRLTNYGPSRTASVALNPKQALWVGKTVEDSLTALCEGGQSLFL